MTQCLRPIRLKTDEGERLVPCGRCNACLLRARSEWAFRLRQEWRVSDYAFFVTLTYDDAHLPIKEFLDKESGCLVYVPCVHKIDVQLFMKRLRKRLPPRSLKYYVISEYGSEFKTARPHYHAVFFLRTNENLSNEIFYHYCVESWPNGMEVTCSELNEGRILYVTSYCYDHFINPPEPSVPNFRLVSRGGRKSNDGYQGHGIGYEYSQEYREFHKSGQKFGVYDKGYINLPRYLKEKIFDDDEIEAHNIECDEKARKLEAIKFADVNGDLCLLRKRAWQDRRNYIERTNKTIFKKKHL